MRLHARNCEKRSFLQPSTFRWKTCWQPWFLGVWACKSHQQLVFEGTLLHTALWGSMGVQRICNSPFVTEDMHLEQKLGSVKLHFVCWLTGWSKSSEAIWFLSIEQFGVGWEVTGGWYEKKCDAKTQQSFGLFKQRSLLKISRRQSGNQMKSRLVNQTDENPARKIATAAAFDRRT